MNIVVKISYCGQSLEHFDWNIQNSFKISNISVEMSSISIEISDMSVEILNISIES